MTSRPEDPLPLRAENKRRTRERIVDATVEIVRASGAIDFSMPEVAERSGVALRTLYRYFPQRQELVNALAQVADQAQIRERPTSLDELEPWLVAAWSALLDEEALLRAQHAGSEGAEVRRMRTPLHRAVVGELLDTLGGQLTSEQKDDLVDLILLMTSSTAMFEFVDVIGTSAERGARLAARAVVRMIRDASENGAV